MTQLDPGIIPSPLADPIAWMSATINGQTWGPKNGLGKVVVLRAARPYKWQIKDASGQDGATPTYRGKKPPDFTLAFHMWTDAQFQFWQTFQLAFLYDASKQQVDPVDIYTPQLAMVGISQIHVDELGAPEQQGERLYWIAEVKVKEFLPPIAQNVTQTPTGSNTSNPESPGTQPDAAAEALQKEIGATIPVAVSVGVLSGQGSGLP
jgi:hypothetical protein